MMRISKYLILLYLLLISLPCWGQPFTVISKVLDEKNNPFERYPVIYSFESLEDAQTAYEIIKEGHPCNEYLDKSECDRKGSFNIQAEKQGALLVVCEIRLKGNKIPQTYLQIVDLKGGTPQKIEVTAANQIQEVTVSQVIARKPQKAAVSHCLPGKVIVDNRIIVKPHVVLDNVRLVVQPLIVNCADKDSVEAYSDSIYVYQGTEYSHTTAALLGFKPERDPLYKYIKDTVAINGLEINYRDTFNVDPNREAKYQFRAIQMAIGYHREPYVNDTVDLSYCQCINPFRFLEIKLPIKNLDFAKFKREPELEKRRTTNSVHLIFLQNEAQLDYSSARNKAHNEAQMNKHKETLLTFMQKGVTLDSIVVVGISSPEGIYEKNLSLAMRRAEFLSNDIKSTLRRPVTVKCHAQVRTWYDLADSLAISNPVAAKDIRSILSSSPRKEVQDQHIRSLACYIEDIEPTLSDLRKDECLYYYKIRRFLTPEEILDKYQNDTLYKTGQKYIPAYEYWHLFQLIKDPVELFSLYNRAYDETRDRQGKPWALAANLLAVELLKRDSTNVEILDSLIDYRRPADYESVFYGDYGVTRTLINPAPAVANQMHMLLRAKRYGEASILADNLPKTSEYDIFRSFSNCLLGYYKDESNAKNFQDVFQSSPRNAVVMSLAMETEEYDLQAEKLWNQLDTTQAVTWYLKAVINNRLFRRNPFDYDYAQDEARDALIKAWSKDPKLAVLASDDGEFVSENKQSPLRLAAIEWDKIKNAKKETADNEDEIPTE